MNAKKGAIWLAVIFAAIWLLLPGKDASAAERKIRVLEVTRGDYGNQSEDLTPGPQNDGKNFGRIIQKAYGESNVEIVTRDKNGVTTVNGVQTVIQDTFAEARDGDVNYFYYSGHGSTTGLYLGANAVMSAGDLAKGFEGIRGTNILVVDCCYSGGLASRSARAVSGAGEFVDDFVNEFGAAVADTADGNAEARSALTNSKFKLLMASSEEELSWQMGFKVENHEISVGGCTMTLCYGCGIDPLKVWDDTATAEDYGLNVVSADYDLNGEVSMSEARRYVENTYHYSANHVRSYPAEDSSCFIPVNEERKPKITFENAYINTTENAVDICYSSRESAVVDYAVYFGDSESLGSLTYAGLNYGEVFDEYDGLTQVKSVSDYNKIVPDSQNDYVIRIPLENYADGKYYVLLQTEGQELRYLVPFTVASGENAALKDNFQIRFSGDCYTAGDAEGEIGTFEAENGEELTVRADFGSGTNLDEETPYLSCYVYNAEGQLIRTLGSRELMQIVPEYGSDGETLKAAHYYRNFYWDGKDKDGNPVPGSTYYVRVIATGAVSADEMESVVVRRQGEQAGVTFLTMSEEEINLPLAADAEKPQIIFMADADGTVTLKLRRTEENETIDTALGNYTAVAGKRYAATWNGMLEGVVAPSGNYVVVAEFRTEGAAGTAAEKVSEPFTVRTADFAPTVEEIPEDGLQAEFPAGAECAVLLKYSLNYPTTVTAYLYDADGKQVAVLANNQEVESGEQQISWDGKINGKEAASGTYKLTVLVKNALSGVVETMVNQVEIAVTGLKGAAEPEKPVDPTNPTDPTQPTDPTDPTDPTQPTDPTKPTEPGDSTEQEEPGSETIQIPADPADPAKPAGPKEEQILPVSVAVRAGEKTVKKITAGVKEKIQLAAVISPANASSRSVTYTSSNPKVAAVTASGKVTAKKTGKAVITVTTENGRTAAVTVTVKQSPKKIKLSAKSKTLKVKKTYKVKVKFPAKTASYKVTFTSSKKSVASVDTDGKIRALKKGKAVITAKTFNGKKARITITVK